MVRLIRTRTSDQGTEGRLEIDGRVICLSLELPWRDNAPSLSCIPNGEYEIRLVFSPKFRKSLYGLKGVPGRAGVLIHSGNLAGDVKKGFRTNVQGCILPGLVFGYLEGQRAILNSRIALNKFTECLNGKPSWLQVIGGDFDVA